MQVIWHEKNQGAVPTMQAMIFLGTPMNKVGSLWQTELVKMSGAGADSDEKFGILYPVRGFVF